MLQVRKAGGEGPIGDKVIVVDISTADGLTGILPVNMCKGCVVIHRDKLHLGIFDHQHDPADVQLAPESPPQRNQQLSCVGFQNCIHQLRILFSILPYPGKLSIRASPEIIVKKNLNFHEYLPGDVYRLHLADKNVAPKAPDNEFVKLLVEQQFSAATENFDETMKNTLPPEKLEETWKLTTSQIGPFKQQIGLRTEKQLGYDIVFITCEFEKGHLDIKVVYNDKKQVAGLFFVPTSPDVLESYRQTPQLVTQKQPYIEIDDPNTAGLVRIIQRLNTVLNETTTAQNDSKNQLDELRNRFDDAVATGFEKEQTLLAEKEKYEQQIHDIKKDYDDLKALTQQTAEQQVQTLMARLDEEKADSYALKQDLLKTKAQLEVVR